jgi:hypothetical protein
MFRRCPVLLQTGSAIRHVVASFVLLAFALTVGSAATQGEQHQASRAADFIDSVGVNTHFSYTDTAYYQKPDEIIRAIQKLGVHHVRDGLAFGWVAPHLYSIYPQLARADIHPLLVMPNPKNGGPSAETIERLLPNYPGVDGIEAPNEYDQTKNPNWAEDLRSFMPTLCQVGSTAGIPVVGPSLTKPESYSRVGDVSAFMDFNNLHAYWGGRNPETGGWGGPDTQGHLYGSFPFHFDHLSITGPSKPVIMTETGYTVTDFAKQNDISESLEAIYYPRLLLHAWNVGVKRTYIYELMDDPSSPKGIGLMRRDLSLRPAFNAVSNLMALLSDSTGTLTPGKLEWTTLNSNSSGIETTLLQKHDRSFWLALWVPASSYEVDKLHPIPVPTRQMTIAIGGGKQVRDVWTFDGAGNTQKTSFNKATVTIPVAETVTLMEIR